MTVTIMRFMILTFGVIVVFLVLQIILGIGFIGGTAVRSSTTNVSSLERDPSNSLEASDLGSSTSSANYRPDVSESQITRFRDYVQDLVTWFFGWLMEMFSWVKSFGSKAEHRCKSERNITEKERISAGGRAHIGLRRRRSQENLKYMLGWLQSHPSVTPRHAKVKLVDGQVEVEVVPLLHPKDSEKPHPEDLKNLHTEDLENSQLEDLENSQLEDLENSQLEDLENWHPEDLERLNMQDTETSHKELADQQGTTRATERPELTSRHGVVPSRRLQNSPISKVESSQSFHTGPPVAHETKNINMHLEKKLTKRRLEGRDGRDAVSGSVQRNVSDGSRMKPWYMFRKSSFRSPMVPRQRKWRFRKLPQDTVTKGTVKARAASDESTTKHDNRSTTTPTLQNVFPLFKKMVEISKEADEVSQVYIEPLGPPPSFISEGAPSTPEKLRTTSSWQILTGTSDATVPSLGNGTPADGSTTESPLGTREALDKTEGTLSVTEEMTTTYQGILPLGSSLHSTQGSSTSTSSTVLRTKDPSNTVIQLGTVQEDTDTTASTTISSGILAPFLKEVMEIAREIKEDPSANIEPPRFPPTSRAEEGTSTASENLRMTSSWQTSGIIETSSITVPGAAGTVVPGSGHSTLADGNTTDSPAGVIVGPTEDSRTAPATEKDETLTHKGVSTTEYSLQSTQGSVASTIATVPVSGDHANTVTHSVTTQRPTERKTFSTPSGPIEITSNAAAAEELLTSEDHASTQHSASTEDLLTTEELVVIDDSVTIEDSVPTEDQTTIKYSVTSELPTTTKYSVTTELPVTTEDSEIPEALSTTEDSETIEDSAVSEESGATEDSVTSQVLVTTVYPTRTEGSAATENLATTESLTNYSTEHLMDDLVTTENPEDLATTTNLVTTHPDRSTGSTENYLGAANQQKDGDVSIDPINTDSHGSASLVTLLVAALGIVLIGIGTYFLQVKGGRGCCR